MAVPDGVDDGGVDLLPEWPTAEEIAFAEELARLYPADHGDVIYVEDVGVDADDATWSPADEAAAAVLASASRPEGCGGADLLLLESVDPASLQDPLARIAYLKVLDRVEAAVAARRLDTVLSLVPVLPDPADYAREHALQVEVAVASRSSLRAAQQLVDAARAVRMVFPSFREALAAGRVGERHMRILVERTRVIEDAATLVLIGEQAVGLAMQLTPARFQDALDRVIVALDPDAPARRRRARGRRDVWSCSLPDGMRFLGITGDAATIAAMVGRIQHAAHALQRARGGAAAVRAGHLDAAISACRADAAAALVLGAPQADGSIALDPQDTVVHVQLVIDLQTLRGEAAHPALLDGSPIPARLGREIAGYAKAFRRIVTDPVAGHCLDYGRETYLPKPLREYVLHRDGRCRIPGCAIARIDLLQMDHARPFPDGPSTPANTGALSTACHQAKTAGHLHLEDSRADGSCTLVTLLGQRITIPARPYLDMAPPAGAPPPFDDDAPPF